MGAYVGIDLHPRRSVAVCLDETGQRLWSSVTVRDIRRLADH
ncbi:MAG: hypothetical protein ACXW15_10125 [Acidimicrobiia bacterium]